MDDGLSDGSGVTFAFWQFHCTDAQKKNAHIEIEPCSETFIYSIFYSA